MNAEVQHHHRSIFGNSSLTAASYLLVGVGGLTAGFWIASAFRPEVDMKNSNKHEPASTPALHIAEQNHESTNCHPQPLPRGSLAEPSVPIQDDADEIVKKHRRDQSFKAVRLLRARVDYVQAMMPSTTTEGVANQIDGYVHAWVDVTTSVAPELVDDIAQAIEETMCSEQASDGQLVVLSRVIARSPELANKRSLECILGRSKAEDTVLWEALKAWESAALLLPESEILTQLEHRCSDQRSTKLFERIRGKKSSQTPDPIGEIP
jgi:hypothetical protein